MKTPGLIISIPEPCNENWEQMTPADRGRYCASCRKTVIDGTILTDAELLRMFRQAKDNPPCCHLHISQLGRVLTEPKENNSFSARLARRIAASLLFFQVISNTVWAQIARPAITHHSKKTVRNPSVRNRITGTVTDYATNEKLRGMQVGIKGTDITATTDAEGKFRLSLPDSFRQSVGTLQVSYTNTSGSKPENTMVPDEIVQLDSVFSKSNVALYRYPVDNAEPVKVNAYKVPVVNHDNFSGVPVVSYGIKPISVSDIKFFSRRSHRVRGKKDKHAHD